MSTIAHMYLSRPFAAEGVPFVTGSRAIGVLAETLGSVTQLGEFSVSVPDGGSDFDCSTPSACVASGASCDAGQKYMLIATFCTAEKRRPFCRRSTAKSVTDLPIGSRIFDNIVPTGIWWPRGSPPNDSCYADQRSKLSFALRSKVPAPCSLAISMATRNDASACCFRSLDKRANSSPCSRWSSAS